MPARAAAALPRELRGRPHAAPADARSEERIMPCGDSEFLMWRREWHTSGSPTLVLDTQVNSYLPRHGSALHGAAMRHRAHRRSEARLRNVDDYLKSDDT